MGARRRYGGVSLGAALSGALSGAGFVALVATFWTGKGHMAFIYNRTGVARTSLGSVIAGLVLLGVAFLLAGWVAGRMARYDGARNGGLAAVSFVALAGLSALLGAIFGERFNVFPRDHLPQWFSHHVGSPESLITTAIGVGGILILATIAGKIGDHYHSRVDRVIAATADGGLGQLEVEDDTSGIQPTVLTGGSTVIRPGDRAAAQP